MDYSYLKNNRNLKAFFKDASSAQIRQIIEKLEELFNETVQKEEEALKRQAERENFLKGMLASLEGHNYTVDDLAALAQVKDNSKKRTMKARYCYEDLEGNECFWSGQGKIPVALKQVMQRDGITDKKHYLIKEYD
ncbi:MAG: hypothetical protein ACI4UM_05415 [Succinivibrio sp.]